MERSTSGIPHSFQSRAKTRSGPIRRIATGSISPAAWASRTAKLSQWRSPERIKRSNCPLASKRSKSSQGGDYFLADLFALAHAMHDLEITIGTDWLAPKKHGGCLALQPATIDLEIKQLGKTFWQRNCTTFSRSRHLDRPRSRSRTTS